MHLQGVNTWCADSYNTRAEFTYTYSESEARESNPKINPGDKEIVSMFMCVCACITYSESDTRESKPKTNLGNKEIVSIHMCVYVLCVCMHYIF